MPRIFKYPLLPQRRQVIQLPAGAKILRVGHQANPAVKAEPDHGHAARVPVLWAEVDEANHPVPVNVLSIATGDVLNDDEQSFLYVDTLQLPGRHVDEAVFHVYIRPEVLPPVSIARVVAPAIAR